MHVHECARIHMHAIFANVIECNNKMQCIMHFIIVIVCAKQGSNLRILR